MEINHYEVLGFEVKSISVEELTKLNSNEISKAYKSKALELHPDKRPNDPNANFEFQQLKTSYDILMDVKLRMAFDTNLLMDVKLSKDFYTNLLSKYEEERRWQQRHKKVVDPDEKEKEMDMATRWKERHKKTVDPDENEKEMDLERRLQQRHKKMVDPDEKEKEKEMDMADSEAFKKGLERKMMTDVEKKKEWLQRKFEEEKESVLTQKRKLDEGEERRRKIMKTARDLVMQEEKDRQLRKMMSNIEKDEERRRR